MRHTSSRLRPVWMGGALLSLAAACAAEPPSSPGHLRAALEEGCTELGSTILQHACGHGSDGTGLSRTANVSESFAGASPNVNTPHTYWTVNLPLSGGMRRGTVKYVPGSGTGDYAIYQLGTVSLTVRDSAGAVITPVLTHEVVGCDVISRVRVYPMTGGQTYRLTFGPTSSTSSKIVIEQVDDFEVFYYADLDQDGFGDLFDSVSTACLPPDGRVTDSSDCDDTDPSVHPGVPDPPGGEDLDCDGVP